MELAVEFGSWFVGTYILLSLYVKALAVFFNEMKDWVWFSAYTAFASAYISLVAVFAP